MGIWDAVPTSEVLVTAQAIAKVTTAIEILLMYEQASGYGLRRMDLEDGNKDAGMDNQEKRP
jgi:hypothetical protein